MTAVRALVVDAALIAVLVVLAACSGDGAAASASPPPAADVSIDAKGNVFSTPELGVPAGEPFQLFFRNLDDVPHNVAIYADQSASEPIYVGETITNSAVTYELPAIEAGTYFFRCDVHPEMAGRATAGG